MPYQITQQYTQDDEKFIAEFRLLKDAKAYIQAKLETNLQLKLNIISVHLLFKYYNFYLFNI